jgi:anti-anti-sigma factor
VPNSPASVHRAGEPDFGTCYYPGRRTHITRPTLIHRPDRLTPTRIFGFDETTHSRAADGTLAAASEGNAFKACGEGRTIALSDSALQPDLAKWVAHMVGFCCRTVLFSDNCTVAYLRGELDACSATSLRARLTPVAMAGRDIVVDPAGLSFVDTAGVIALVDLLRVATTAGGSLRLTKPPRLLRRLLTLAGISDAFVVVDHVPSG